MNPEGMRGAFRVERSNDWIINASAHINKILSETFPHVGVDIYIYIYISNLHIFDLLGHDLVQFFPLTLYN